MPEEKIFPHLSQTDDDYQGRFAILIDSIPMKKRGQTGSMTEAAEDLGRFADFINQLYIVDMPVSFSFRTILRANHTPGGAGDIKTALFVSTRGAKKKKIEEDLKTLLNQTTIVISSTFPRYRFSPVKEEERFSALWQPFNLENAHFCEIRKRESIIRLSRIKPEKPLGFFQMETQSTFPDNPETVYFAHPFIPRTKSYERLYRLLMCHGKDFMMQVSLTPTTLSTAEENALVDEIAKCEGFAPDANIPFNQMFLERARLLGHGLLDQLLRLQDAPFYLQIILASPEPINKVVAEAIGVCITHPVGLARNMGQIDYRLQMGGYDILFPQNDVERKGVIQDLLHPGQTSWQNTKGAKHLARLRFLVDGCQGTCAFRLPRDDGSGQMGLKTHHTTLRPMPRAISELAHHAEIRKRIIGENNALGFHQPIYLTDKDLSQHMYIVGQTGTGKTTLLKSMILEDIHNKRGLAVIDPHGDLYHELLHLIPKERIEDIVLFDPLDMNHPVGFNLLDCDEISQRHFVAREMKAIMHRLLHDTYGDVSNTFIGPVFYKHVQMNLLLTMSDPDVQGTLLEFYEIFQHKSYWRRWLPLKWDEPLLKVWVEEILPQIDYVYRPRSDAVSLGEYISSKFADFILDPRLRLIFGQRESSVHIREIMDSGKILLVNLAKGMLGEATAQFLGLVLMAKFQSEILGRAEIPTENRNPFTIYVDEFQSLATENFSLLLSEARKFGVSLVLANQFISQIHDQRIMEAIFGNVGTMLAFRVGKNDAASIASQFSPAFDAFDLANLPNWHACVKMTVNGKTVSPFSLQTTVPSMQRDSQTRARVLQQSRQQYGRPRHEVENTIQESLKMPEMKEKETQDLN